MSTAASWLAALLTIMVVALYEIWFARAAPPTPAPGTNGARELARGLVRSSVGAARLRGAGRADAAQLGHVGLDDRIDGPIGAAHVRRAGILYSWSLRNLVLVVPAVAFVLHPAAGPLAAVVVALVLFAFDRVQTST